MSEPTPALRPGLVSVTFRALSRTEIVRVAREARLEGIEWGGDVHVPPGDDAAAREAARLTEADGLQVAAYGSYYRCRPGDDFSPVLDTAAVLGAPMIRVWPGNKGSAETSADERRGVVEEIRRISELAAQQGILIAAEWHGGTLTDEPDSGLSLADEVDHPNFRLYWQPSRNRTFEQRMAELERVLPHLAHVHAFHWLDLPDREDRRVLAEGEADWQRYLRVAAEAPAMPNDVPRFAMLEFVRSDEPAQLAEDAATLRRWLA